MADLKLRPGFALARTPRILFCDVDRTLLTYDHVLLPEVAAAMRSLRSINLPVVLASARSPAGLDRVHAEVGAAELVCCFNGAWVGKLSSRQALKEVRLGRELALEAMSTIHAAGGSPIWFDLGRCYVLAADEKVARLRTDVTGDDLEMVRNVEDIPGAPLKLLATFSSDRISEAIGSLSNVFTGRVTVTQSGPNLVEFVDPHARKDLAASFIAQSWNVDPNDVAAAGDSDNDIAMLSWAGLAITVANAKEHVQDLADVVAPSCDDGGLARALTWLVQNAPSVHAA
ncbi:MAG: HAD family hydrolase [Alphaproteobacteria bacterium]|nr:HAD family hydrolase [Alphaproteobacteria bacterium]